MILVLAGTQDGREIAAKLALQQQAKVLVSTVSEYGGQLAACDSLTVLVGKLDKDAMKAVIMKYHVSLLIDATHPYAVTASETARKVCRETGIPYCRYERPAVALPNYAKLIEVASAEEAAKAAAKLGQVVFLTTGSRTLGTFAKEPLLRDKRLIARVLPDPAVLAECFELGFTPHDIIAMQGPFSQTLNAAMFAECGAEVIVMKNSGTIGGSDAKLLAAMELSLFLVVITRPPLSTMEYPLFSSEEEVIMWAAEQNAAMDTRC